MRQRPKSPGNDVVALERGVIALYVRDLDQLFNSLDPSPFHERGLNADAEEYIVACAKELPGGGPAEIVVYLDQPLGLPDETRMLADAIHRHFERETQLLRWRLRRLIRRGLISLAIGLTVLALALIGREFVTQSLGGGHLARVFGESLHIGGWVAMWYPMEVFLYEWWPLLGERRIHGRLAAIPVRIVYREAGPNTAREQAPSLSEARGVTA